MFNITHREAFRTVFHASLQDVASPSSIDSFSFSAMFSRIIAMFLNLLSSKDEEISMLRTRSIERAPISISDESRNSDDEMDELSYAYSRIHDLIEAKDQQHMYYVKLLEAIQASYQCNPVVIATAPENENSSQDNLIQELRMQVRSLTEKLENAREDAKNLEENNRKFTESISL